MCAGEAQAAIVDWANWSSASTGVAAGNATGVTGGINFTYNGEVEILARTINWDPASSYVGGRSAMLQPPVLVLYSCLAERRRA